MAMMDEDKTCAMDSQVGMPPAPPKSPRRLCVDELEGETISGRYQIVRRIGKGGMGVVYLAQQTNLKIGRAHV